MARKVLQKIPVLPIGIFFFFAIVLIILSQVVRAGNLGNFSVRLDRLGSSDTTGGTVCAKPTTVGTEVDVKVTFPTGFVLNTTTTNWTVTTTGLPGGTSAWLGIGTATAVSGQTATFPSTDLTVGTTYCFNFSGTNTLTNGTAGNDKTGTIVTEATGSVTIDSGTYALSIISDDQIIISATINPTFTFALGGNTDTFSGALSAASVTSTAGRTASVTTNAANGWITWVKSANAALSSSSTASSIATAGSVDNVPTDLSATTGYVLDVDITTDSAQGTGTITQASGYGAEYAGANTTSGGTLSTIFQPIAASSGTTGGDVLTLIERAKVIATQAAASDYTDTLTVVAAGRF